MKSKEMIEIKRAIFLLNTKRKFCTFIFKSKSNRGICFPLLDQKSDRFPSLELETFFSNFLNSKKKKIKWIEI